MAFLRFISRQLHIKHILFIAICILFVIYILQGYYRLITLPELIKSNDQTTKINNLTPVETLNNVNTEKQTQSKSQDYVKFDEECDALGEWVELNNRNVYFRKSFAFYFMDVGIFRCFFIMKNSQISKSMRLNLNLKIKIRDSVIEHVVTDTLINTPWFVDYYGLVPIDAWFDLNEILKDKNISLTENLNDIKVDMYFHDRTSGDITKTPIDMKLRNAKVPNDKKKFSTLCSKCTYLHKRDNKHMNWWFEINKRIGYDKLKIYFNAPNHDQEFLGILDKYKDFVYTENYKCLPNFLSEREGDNSRRKYLSHYTEMTVNREYVALMSDVFSGLSVNECYLDNIDKYRFINVDDYDDTIMPRKSETYPTFEFSIQKLSSLNGINDLKNYVFNDKCDRYTSNGNSTVKNATDIEYFINDLQSKLHYSDSASYYFGQGNYIKHKDAKKIFDAFEKYFFSKDFNESLKEHVIEVVDNEPSIPNEHHNYNYIFKIEGKDQIDYVRNLCRIFKELITPYMDKHQEIISKHVDRYDRFFMISGHTLDFSLGKTIHNTISVFEITLHKPYKSIMNSNRPGPANYESVPYNYGHMSHFRNMLVLPKNKKIPITDLHLDLNYLNCYFRPILKDMTGTTDL